jgi:hypothetical protein
MNPQILRLVLALLGVTIAYNIVEGPVAIWSGVEAGSLALVAFGADSYSRWPRPAP